MDTVPSKLLAIDELQFSTKPAENKWSPKEILGHLIDSAANNHQRIIRVQDGQAQTISYDQDKWVRLNHYNVLSSQNVIGLWTLYNTHILEIIKLIPERSLTNIYNTGTGNVSLEWLIEDYVVHMQHHIDQIIKV